MTNSKFIKGATTLLVALFLLTGIILVSKANREYKFEATCHIDGDIAYFSSTNIICGNVFAWDIEDDDHFIEGEKYILIMSTNGTDNTAVDDIIKEIIAK